MAEVPTLLAPGEKSNRAINISSAGAPISTVGGPAVPTKRVCYFFFIMIFRINLYNLKQFILDNLF